MPTESIPALLEKALAAREPLFDSRHETAFRLFNGFSEGQPHLSLDLYAGTVIFHDYAPDESTGRALVREAADFIQKHPLFAGWLRAGIAKYRSSSSPAERRGALLFGGKPDRKVREHGIWYAVDLTMNRDASLYLDTRPLRKWLIENMRGKSVLNTFAYTGSFGVAALAGGAARVVQMDLNRQFLNLAKDSYSLNGFPIHKSDFIAQDFFPAVSRFKHAGETFDCVLIDPPFFSSTTRGRVDQEHENARLVNKVRPLINDGGTLIAINNALYVSGREYMQTLETLCADGYLKIRDLMPVPGDFVGYQTVGKPITDPAPFNHSTKIAILDVRRK
ncbi:MAG: class I SAM-dependent methyltransferase [Chloroflexi bacterium]|nr:class I SAM-dependent methyltransferase [Chloroflexota bacterium]